MKKLVIFDLDGTLLNTIADLAAATNYALEKCGYPRHNPEIYPTLVGNGVTKLIERALPQDHRSEPEVETVRRKFMEYYDDHCCDLTAPYPGIHQLLVHLHANGIAVAVASNKYQEAVERIISHFFPGVEWAAVEGHRSGVPSKPDPSIVFAILSQHPTPKDEVLYVGDSGVDMDTAHRACVDCVGVTWGFRPESELKKHYADSLATSPDQILDICLRDS